MLKDVIDGLKLVADGIKNVKTIAEAVRSGKDYLKSNHPDVKNDLRAMITELGKSMFVIKRASAVLTNFRFAITTDTRGSELARFNDYFIQSKTEAQHLRNNIEDLRSHCSRIREYGEKISGSATATGFNKVFELLGLKSPERERKLGKQLGELAHEDFNVANSAEQMLECLEWALRDIQNALGVGGSMYPQNIPDACALLGQYGPEFDILEEQAALAVKDIRELAKDLE
jgi:hypothetical protein